MTLEQFIRATSIVNEIEQCKNYIRMIEYSQYENVSEREADMTYHGIFETIVIPKSLFKVIGKLILSEYQQRLTALEKELSEL